MYDWNKLNKDILPLVEENLGKIRSIPEDEKYEAITEMLANVSLSPDEKLKLRKRLKIEFGYPPLTSTRCLVAGSIIFSGRGWAGRTDSGRYNL